MQEKIEWRNSVPILRNKVILKQLGLAIGIPFGLLIVFLLSISSKSSGAFYGVVLIVALLFLTWLFIMAVYGGKYDVQFMLDDKGALCWTQAQQAKKNKIINSLTVVLGLFSGKPTVAGAGMLAQARQKTFMPWAQITKVQYRPRQNTIILRGGWTDNMALFCTAENYSLVEKCVKYRTQKIQW